MSKTDRRAFLQQSTLAGIALCSAGDDFCSAPAETKNAPRRLRTVALEGPPHQRGVMHGAALKDDIAALLKLWKADLAERYKMDAEAFIKKFVRRTDYLPAIEKWTPDLLEEIQGIAKGADADFDTMLVFQLVDEYWVNGPGVAGEHCSALGIGKRPDQPCRIAQNMDLEGFRDGFQTVLQIKHPDSALESFVLTNAGLIGLNGMNNRSIGICCNTLGQLANCRDGLPVACVLRGVLQQETEEAALDFLRRVKHASGQNYIVGGPSKVYDYECSAHKVVQFTPSSGPDIVWHTNHPLVSDDYTAAHREALEKKKGTGKGEDNSSVRLQSLQKRLGKEGASAGVDELKATLAAKDSTEHPVCRSYRNKKDGYTFAATIMELGEKPEFHVTAGPPDVHPYWTWSFPPRSR